MVRTVGMCGLALVLLAAPAMAAEDAAGNGTPAGEPVAAENTGAVYSPSAPRGSVDFLFGAVLPPIEGRTYLAIVFGLRLQYEWGEPAGTRHRISVEGLVGLLNAGFAEGHLRYQASLPMGEDLRFVLATGLRAQGAARLLDAGNSNAFTAWQSSFGLLIGPQEVRWELLATLALLAREHSFSDIGFAGGISLSAWFFDSERLRLEVLFGTQTPHPSGEAPAMFRLTYEWRFLR